MEEKLVSFMVPKTVIDTAKEYCFKKKLKLKHFIREAIIEALNSRGVKKGISK